MVKGGVSRAAYSLKSALRVIEHIRSNNRPARGAIDKFALLRNPRYFVRFPRR